MRCLYSEARDVKLFLPQKISCSRVDEMCVCVCVFVGRYGFRRCVLRMFLTIILLLFYYLSSLCFSMDPCLTLELSLSKLQLPYGINNLSLTIRIT